ncbi:homeobox protein Hox-A2b-like protein [Lates japonicus]|uniref:Homeobox protein Hox-A2b-like protein n=1 Tax=Lates japonicus TaxID=270547 RepID=A0AAD3RAU4_LATJO|nr:homeobox protein Hox-A2b-like protein [Lates japonicus]
MNYNSGEKSGFINSQPSLAECLTSLTNPVGDAFQSSSIKSSALSLVLIPPPLPRQTVPGLSQASTTHSRSKQALKALQPSADRIPPPPGLPVDEGEEKKKSIKRSQTAAAAAAAIFYYRCCCDSD